MPPCWMDPEPSRRARRPAVIYMCLLAGLPSSAHQRWPGPDWPSSRRGAAWAVTPNPMLSRFAADVSPTQAAAYPRPQLTRPSWEHLNGMWLLDIQHGVTTLDAGAAPSPDAAKQQVLVPYPIEAALSGVREQPGDWVPDPANPNMGGGSTPCAFWYSRNFTAGSSDRLQQHQRTVLRFEAVMSEAVVLLNGNHVGTHSGGYDDFSFDITQFLRPGINLLQVGAMWRPLFRGKQFDKKFYAPGGIMYTSSSGIWQTVWLEHLQSAPSGTIATVVGRTWEDLSCFELVVSLETPASTTLRATLSGAGGRALAFGDNGKSSCSVRSGERYCVLPVPVSSKERRPWTPDDPFLYNFTIVLTDDSSGSVLDSVGSYAALRTIGTMRTSGNNVTRLTLNNELVYLIGTLDQGYWPEGAYTAPTDEAMVSDLLALKSLGFNAVRKHQKIEPRRYYYHCDRLGIAVVQDFPSYGGASGFRNATINAAFRAGLLGMVARTEAHPSVIAYSIWNEGSAEPWNASGAAAYIESTVDFVARADRTAHAGNHRLIDAGSGWHQSNSGSILSSHSYYRASVPVCDNTSAQGLPDGDGSLGRGHFPLPDCAAHVLINSEFGGLCLPPYTMGRKEWFDTGHEQFFGAYNCSGWNRPYHPGDAPCLKADMRCCCDIGSAVGEIKASGNDIGAVTRLYTNITGEIVRDLLPQGVSANFYTQTTDVETEADGILTYDRVMKVEPGAVFRANDQLKRAAKRFFATLGS